MSLSPKIIRKQLELFRPIITGCSIDTSRKGQDIMGSLMFAGKKNITVSRHDLPNFEGIWAYPSGETKNGVILYLHGGGFISGDKIRLINATTPNSVNKPEMAPASTAIAII